MIINVGIRTNAGAQTIPVEIPEPLTNSAGSVDLHIKSDLAYPSISAIVDPAMKSAGISAITSVGITGIVEVDGPNKGRLFVKVQGTIKGRKGQWFQVGIDTRPELAALIANRDAIQAAISAARKVIHDAERAEEQAQDERLLAEMRRKEAELATQIPAGHIRVDYKMHSSYDGGDWADYSAQGVPVRWDEITLHGWASAIRPGAGAAFEKVPVASISPERLSEVRSRYEAKQAQKEAQDAATRKERDAQDARKADLQAKLSCRVIQRGSRPGEDGRDPYALVELTSAATGETLRFSCRNVFDFGYVVNPAYSITPGREPGGMANDGQWMDFKAGDGWVPVRPLTETETLALQYLYEFPPISKEIRL